MALRVVSLPATTSRMKNDAELGRRSAARRRPRRDQRGGEVVGGCSRRSSAELGHQLWPARAPASSSAVMMSARRSGDVLRVAGAEDDVGAVEDRVVVAASGMPIMSQMIWSGSRAATSVTKSHSPSLDARRRRSRAAIRSTSSSTACSSMRGRERRGRRCARSRACRGSSMLIIEPKNSLNSAGMSTMFVPPRRPRRTARVAAGLDDVGVPDQRVVAGPRGQPVHVGFRQEGHRVVLAQRGERGRSLLDRRGPESRDVRQVRLTVGDSSDHVAPPSCARDRRLCPR